MLPSLLDQSPEIGGDAMLVVTSDRRVSDANTAALKFTGYTLDALRATRIDELIPEYPADPPDDQPGTGKHRTNSPVPVQGSPGPAQSQQLHLRHKDGRLTCVSVHVSQTTSGKEQCQLISVREVAGSSESASLDHFAAQRSATLSRLAANWVWELDEHLRFTFLSGQDLFSTRSSEQQFIGKTYAELPITFESANDENEFLSIVRARSVFRDMIVQYKGGTRDRYFSISGEPLFGGDQQFLGYRGISKDVSEIKQSELRLSRLRDYYVLLSATNHAIIHTKSANKLFQLACDAAVEHGHFLFAWTGLVNDANRTIDPVAVAGAHHGYTEQLHISIDPGAGTSPVLDVLWTGDPYISNDSSTGADQALRDYFSDTPIAAHAVFPLRRSGRVIGTFHLYSQQANIFDSQLIELLLRVGDNLSFALGRFEYQASREATEQALRESEKRFRDIADVASGYMWENDIKGRFTFLSSRVAEFLGYTSQELIGKSGAMLMPPGEIERVREWFKSNMGPDGAFRGLENRMVHKSGRVCWQRISGVATRDPDGTRTGHRGTAHDVTELKASEARIIKLATRDALTDLPNRLLFHDRLLQSIDNARRAEKCLAILFVDLDRFKYVNDSLGHDMGDRLLKQVAERMSTCIRSGDTLARLGGDEFVIALSHLRNPADAAQIATKIIESIAHPFEIDDKSLNTSCSIGISLYPADATEATALLKNADTAMYHAKDCGRNNYQFFTEEMNARVMVRHEVEVALRRAIENREFVLHYQPQTRVEDSTVIGAEALLRWNDPVRGLVPPGDFIQVAEDSGLIEPIGRWVLIEACSQARRWTQQGHPPIRVAINISARQLTDPDEFLAFVIRTLNDTGVDPRQIELEVTESLLLNHVEENARMLRKLGQLGVRIAVDDFGTGYSSLAYIKRLPIDSIKIDRSFVSDIETDPDDAEIIKAIIAMAHGLRLRVTAEGVETVGQLAALRQLECDEYQGYLVSKPVDAESFARTFLQDAVRSTYRESTVSQQA